MRPDFIERRRSPRILTWRNSAKLGGALLFAFVAITIRSELRGTHTRDYGRLLGGQIDRTIPQKPPVEVVQETQPVDDQTAPDPTLVEPLAREQWLHDASSMTPAVEPVPAQGIAPRVGDRDVVIVGGPEGLRVMKKERRKPVLSGGFGR